jgi:hypothetical protein
MGQNRTQGHWDQNPFLVAMGRRASLQPSLPGAPFPRLCLHNLVEFIFGSWAPLNRRLSYGIAVLGDARMPNWVAYSLIAATALAIDAAIVIAVWRALH